MKETLKIQFKEDYINFENLSRNSQEFFRNFFEKAFQKMMDETVGYKDDLSRWLKENKEKGYSEDDIILEKIAKIHLNSDCKYFSYDLILNFSNIYGVLDRRVMYSSANFLDPYLSKEENEIREYVKKELSLILFRLEIKKLKNYLNKAQKKIEIMKEKYRITEEEESEIEAELEN